MTTLHVRPAGNDAADGSADRPLRTLQRAAELAMPGDTVLVHEGEYREWVRPRRGGLDDARRITYAAAEGARVVVKGSERIVGWAREAGTTWRVEIENTLFGDFNPFAHEVAGDWIIYADDAPHKHLGEVYLDGRSFYEAASVAEVHEAVERTELRDPFTCLMVAAPDVDQTRFLWYAEVGESSTTVWANFHGADPNTDLVEINVRPAVFSPALHHLDYITVRGFELAQAATPWSPPTSDQIGLIGPNWAKGWIIEDNVIHDAKCSAISLGKEHSTGHNHFSERGDRPGYQYQIESVFAARGIGWDRERIGSHIVRGNTIYDCGQNGIVGHLGCVFSTIQDNVISRIAVKREFFGHEIGGIKLHAAIDVTIEGNRIHSSTLGIWLDWQTQGTRVTRNVLYDNRRDLYVEVSHGPYVVDHNVFASPSALELQSQGGAFVCNLFAGSIVVGSEMDRATPYHRPHTTHVAGYATIHGGDDRFIGNIFLGGDPERVFDPSSRIHELGEVTYGTATYDPHPPTWEEYLARLAAQPPATHRRYIGVRQPVYLRDNVYAGGAAAYAQEVSPHTLADPIAVEVVTEGDEVFLDCTVPDSFAGARLAIVSSADLPPVRLVGASFEAPDGSSLVLDTDLLGAVRDDSADSPGPIAGLAPGTSRYRLG